MEEFNDKSKTIEFTPLHKEKQQIERTENNIYSQARRNNAKHSPKQDKSTKVLVYTSLILAILVIIAVVTTVAILNMERFKNNAELPAEDEIITENEVGGKEEEEPAPEAKINLYNVVFYGDSVTETADGYSILADLYDETFSHKENRKVFITKETDIRQDGQRLSAQALIYAIDRMAGEGVVFDVKLRESDNVALSISYEGSLEEEDALTGEENTADEEELGNSVEEEAETGEENIENGVVIE